MDTLNFSCPWCGELNDLVLDPGELGQQVVIDCHVCCKPIEIDLPSTPGEVPGIRGEGE